MEKVLNRFGYSDSKRISTPYACATYARISFCRFCLHASRQPQRHLCTHLQHEAANGGFLQSNSEAGVQRNPCWLTDSYFSVIKAGIRTLRKAGTKWALKLVFIGID
jgi:hypothetical protein